MKILFLTSHKYIPEIYGGMEINTHQLCQKFLTKGHSVGVLCGLAGVGFTGLVAKFKVKISSNKCAKDIYCGYPVWRAWDPLEYVNHIIDIYTPDIVIVQGGHQFYDLIFEVLKRSIPVVAYLHTPDTLTFPEKLKNNKKLIFVANSSCTSDIHKDKSICAVLPPIVEKKTYIVNSTRSKIVFVNPAEYKGVNLVLELAKARPDLEFLFVLTKSEDKKKKFLLNNITVIGPVSDMRTVYSQAKLILAPSIWLETWGRIVTEAHISGIPVLSSDRGGLPESVGSGGICLPIDDVNRWIYFFNKIIDDDDYYSDLVNQCFEMSNRDLINPDLIVERLLEVIKSLD